MGSQERPTFEQIAVEHARFIRKTLARLGVAARDLDDVEQEVLRGIDSGLSTFDPSLSAKREAAARGWIFGICERQAARCRRAEARRGEVLFGPVELDGAACGALHAEAGMLERERMGLLSMLLAGLESHRRAVVVAYELEERSMVEVAALLDIPVNTAWNRLRLGREDLRAAWRRMALASLSPAT